jgi:hypothetical protein
MGVPENVPIHLSIANFVAKLLMSRLTRWLKLFLCNRQIDLARARVSGFTEFRRVGDVAGQDSRSNDRRMDNLIPWPVLGKQWPLGKSCSGASSSPVVCPGSPAAPQAISLPQGPQEFSYARRGSGPRAFERNDSSCPSKIDARNE